ncbi:hypothetical protein OLX02_00395 [Novosphingobium sp. KCTC 2891]|uniref:hypothetical protein n=1 Tax=Novosphingobium sp. KCTC 2891 TaxID=2989730 RepID=UPI002223D2EB|nr:hypothetical protein [Novosphingobium sp. KCTC 2891]MCW1381271.1 hypothetical protein [Novosphingobium sp. KCTC 2891]
MIVTAHRIRSIGWIVLLAICAALVMVLAFRVNAVRSQVHHAEMKIVALRQEKMYLETEFETRANQQQLKAWNDVEFGYVAPTAGQYLENERQLAALSKVAEPDAPAPIRVASVDDSVIAQAAFPAMVSPLSGKPLSDEKPVADDHIVKLDHAAATASLGERLATVDHKRKSDDEDKAPGKAKAASKEKAKRTADKADAKADKSVEKRKAKASTVDAAPTKAQKGKSEKVVKVAKATKTTASIPAKKPVKLAVAKPKTAPAAGKKEVKANK